MGKLKPIEQLPEDVNKGDLVRLVHNQDEYIGYFERCFNETGNNHFMAEFSTPTTFTRLSNVVYLDITGRFLWGGTARIDSYEILRRSKGE